MYRSGCCWLCLPGNMTLEHMVCSLTLHDRAGTLQCLFKAGAVQDETDKNTLTSGQPKFATAPCLLRLNGWKCHIVWHPDMFGVQRLKHFVESLPVTAQPVTV